MQLDIKKSGIIIIGNEILSGKTIDSNSNFLCKALSKKGIIVREITVIPDNQKEIIKVNNFRKNMIMFLLQVVLDQPMMILHRNQLQKHLN